MSHSPLPWESRPDSASIVDADKELVCGCILDADAKLIVQCVNADTTKDAELAAVKADVNRYHQSTKAWGDLVNILDADLWAEDVEQELGSADADDTVDVVMLAHAKEYEQFWREGHKEIKALKAELVEAINQGEHNLNLRDDVAVRCQKAEAALAELQSRVAVLPQRYIAIANWEVRMINKSPNPSGNIMLAADVLAMLAALGIETKEREA